jgi:IS4 transposase
VLPHLKPGMLCLTDRNFFNYKFWSEACATGADQLWRIKTNARLPCEQRLSDGSYLSTTYPTERDRRHKTNGLVLRVIEYALDGVTGAEPLYRLVTTILDPELAPANELGALYHERWEIETSLDEVKTHLRGVKILRSKSPDLVRQEFYALMLAHFVTRALMHEAALKADIDPDRLSFVHAVRVIRRKVHQAPAISPSEYACLAQCCA